MAPGTNTRAVVKLVDFKLQIGARPLGKASVAATAVKHLVRLLRAKRPDLIVSFMEPASLPTTVAAALCGALPRLTVTVRNNTASLSLARRIAIRLFYRAVGRIVAPSRGVRHVLERMGLPGRKLFTIENPVVPREMSCPAPRTPVPFRFILGAGRLHRQKGFDRLLEAFADYDRLDIPQNKRYHAGWSVNVRESGQYGGIGRVYWRRSWLGHQRWSG